MLNVNYKIDKLGYQKINNKCYHEVSLNTKSVFIPVISINSMTNSIPYRQLKHYLFFYEKRFK